VELETVQTHTPTPANANADRKRTRKHVLSKQSRACAFGGVKQFWTLLHSIVPHKAKKSKHQAAAVKRAEEELEHVSNPPQPSTSTVAPKQEAEPKMMAHKNSLSSTISRENPEKVKDEAVRLVRSKTEHATRMFKGEREGLHEAIMNSFSKTAIQWFVRRPNYSEEDLEKEIRDTLHTFSRFLVEWRLGHLMIPALIYTERYFTILRRINDQFIFDLFMTSVVLAIKFWHDQIITNVTYSKMFDILTHILCYNELNFLHAVDYDLNLEEDDVRQFKRRFLYGLPDATNGKEKC